MDVRTLRSRRRRGKVSSNGVLIDIYVYGQSQNNAGVGKSSLLTQYVEDEFHDVFISTIGIDFRNKTLEVAGKTVKLRIWDTAGQERFLTLTSKFYRGSQGILMVYDMTDRRTFENIDKWMQQIKENTGDTDPSIVLVANKNDLQDTREVSKSEGSRLARRYKIPYFETSARTDNGVTTAFEALARDVVKKRSALDIKQKEKRDAQQTSSGTGVDDRVRVRSGSSQGEASSGCPC